MSVEFVHLACVRTVGFVVDSGGTWTLPEPGVRPTLVRADHPPPRPLRPR